MFNLVQIQERLKDLPMQAIMAYVNGSNPQIPPFVALGELNRREQMLESAAAEQAQQMEGAPTIKEQIEQQAGLLALQGDRQRQAGQMIQQQAMNNPMLPAQGEAASDTPVQMAEGGMVNPEMLKRMAVMRAIQSGIREDTPRRRLPAGGLGGLIPRRFRGGGPVAFQTGGSIFDAIFGQGETEAPKKKELVDVPSELTGKIGLAQVKDIRDGRYGTTREEILAAFGMGEEDVVAEEEPVEEEAFVEQSTDRRGSSGSGAGARPTAAPSAGLPSVVDRYLKLNPETAIPTARRTTPEEFKEERAGLDTLFGVSRDPYAELKRRFANIESEDTRRRGEQPMDQLTAFLSAIASSRRGAGFGEAGAAGATASGRLRAEQQALNRKQALDMATLQSAIAEKEDARVRGDRDAFIAAQEKEKAAELAIQKDRIALQQNQAQTANQATSAQAQMISALRPPGQGTSTLEATRLRARAAISAQAEKQFELGGPLYSQYRKKLKAEGQDAADAWKRGKINAYVARQIELIPELGGAGVGASNVIDFNKLPK